MYSGIFQPHTIAYNEYVNNLFQKNTCTIKVRYIYRYVSTLAAAINEVYNNYHTS